MNDHAYPVAVRIETQSTNHAVAIACAWTGEGEGYAGKVWKKQLTTRTYTTPGYVETITDTLSGDITEFGEGECVPTQSTVYEPTPTGTIEEWYEAAGPILPDGSVVTYEEEVTAADIKAFAEGLLEWPEDEEPVTDPDAETPGSVLEWSGVEDWLTPQLAPVEVSVASVVDEYPGGCEITRARMRITRQGVSMDHIPMRAEWEGGGDGSAVLTDEGATTGWVVADDNAWITDLHFFIGPHY